MNENKPEFKTHPQLSYGNHIDDAEKIVIKVDEGEYQGTVFSYFNINDQGDSGELFYQIEFASFMHNGQLFEAEPPSEIATGFYETISSPFLYNAIVEAANKVINKNEQPVENGQLEGGTA